MKKSSSNAVTRINSAYKQFTKNNRESVCLAIKLGHLLNKQKDHVLKRKESWENFASKKFPQIHNKTRQRLMRIARLTGEDSPKSIYLLDITQLYNLCTLCDPDGIENFLTNNHIKLNFKLSDQSVKEFQTTVNKLIQRSKKKTSSKTGPPKQFTSWLIKLEKMSKKESFNLRKQHITTLKNWNKIISEIIKAVEER